MQSGRLLMWLLTLMHQERPRPFWRPTMPAAPWRSATVMSACNDELQRVSAITCMQQLPRRHGDAFLCAPPFRTSSCAIARWICSTGQPSVSAMAVHLF